MTEQTKNQFLIHQLSLLLLYFNSFGGDSWDANSNFYDNGDFIGRARVFLLQKMLKRQKTNPRKSNSDDEPKELVKDDVDQVDLIGLEIRYGLITLVNPESGGQLMARVKGIRKKLSAELGFLVQPVRIRDALNLEPELPYCTKWSYSS